MTHLTGRRPAETLTTTRDDLTPPLRTLFVTRSRGETLPVGLDRPGDPLACAREGRRRRKSELNAVRVRVRVTTERPRDAFNDWNRHDVADGFVGGRSLKGPDRL